MLCNLDNLQNLKGYSHTISWGVFQHLRIVITCVMERAWTLGTDSSSAACPAMMSFICSLSSFIHSTCTYCLLCARAGLCHTQRERLSPSLLTNRGEETGKGGRTGGQDTQCCNRRNGGAGEHGAAASHLDLERLPDCQRAGNQRRKGSGKEEAPEASFPEWL